MTQADIIQTNIVKYADDTGIYCANKDVANLITTITNEMKMLKKWMDENEIILNAKKGKQRCWFLELLNFVINELLACYIYYRS